MKKGKWSPSAPWVRYPGPFAKTPSPYTSPGCARPVKEALIPSKPPELAETCNHHAACRRSLLWRTSLDWQGTGTYGRDWVFSKTCPQTALPPICPQPAALVICVILVTFLGGQKEGLLPYLIWKVEPANPRNTFSFSRLSYLT